MPEVEVVPAFICTVQCTTYAMENCSELQSRMLKGKHFSDTGTRLMTLSVYPIR